MNLFEFFGLWLRRISFAIIKFGQIPKHVTFLITEVPTYYGFADGFHENIYKQNLSKIMDCVEWCLSFGVVEVNFYTFSCLVYKLQENDLGKCIHAFNKILNLWIKNSSSLLAKGIRIHVSDEYKVLPENTKYMTDKIQNLTQMNGKIIVNLVIGFPGVNDLTRKIEHFQSTTKNASISCKKRLIKKFYKRFFNCKMQKPQLIICNCSYKRLSDYLIWKTPSRYMHHIHIIWNKFSWFYFLICILYFQRHQRRLCKK